MKSTLKLTALAATVSAILAAPAAAQTYSGTATGEVTASPVPLVIEEVRPFQMELLPKPGADLTGPFTFSEYNTGTNAWSDRFSQSPETGMVQGCVKVTGPADRTIEVAAISISDLTAPGGSTISPGTSQIAMGGSGVGCDDAPSMGLLGSTPATGPSGGKYTTNSAGELYLVWEYDWAENMTVNQWEEGLYTGTVDLEMTPQ
jgi:hypothetical protein